MKKILLLLIAVYYHALSFAQQDPIYAQYLLNPLVINPAYAGLNNNLNAMVGYRTQWTGMEGQPRTMYASGNVSVADNRVGIGATLSSDKIGITNSTEFNAAFSYKLPVGDNRVLSFGMQGSVLNFKNDLSSLLIYDSNDPAFTGGDRGTRINLGAGLILKSEHYLFGVSVPRLLPSTFKNGGQEFDLYNQHVYVFAAYVWYLNERIRFKPTALLRTVKGAPASVDLAANFNFHSLHTVGVFTRNFNTYGLLVQTLLADKLRLGYVFELPTDKSVGTHFATHEISLGIRLHVFDFHEHTLGNF